MPLAEFDCIRQFFAAQGLVRDDVTLGIGDDAAIVSLSSHQECVVAMDTIVAGRHFFADASAASIGHRALAINLSDLAAMGAIPAWFTLSITMPQIDEAWLTDFSQALFSLANQHDCQLIGGDTTQGPLAITVQAHGLVQHGQALRRDGACVGDAIAVTGQLGAPSYAVAHYNATLAEPLRHALEYPQPQIDAGLILNNYAHSAIDISDGLLGDLGHITTASHVAATVQADAIPIAASLSTLSREQALPYALNGGDDYQLCFTLAQEKISVCQQALAAINVDMHVIGSIDEGEGVRVLNSAGEAMTIAQSSFQHFQEP